MGVPAAAPVEVTTREVLAEVTLEESARVTLGTLSVDVDTPTGAVVLVLFSTVDLQRSLTSEQGVCKLHLRQAHDIT